MASINLVNQHPGEPETALHHRLSELLEDPQTRELRMAVAYVNWHGLSAIADSREKFLENDGVVRSIFGVDNGVTTPDALAYTLYLQDRFPDGYQLAAVFPWQFADSIFHPKFFEFYRDTDRVALVGSGNLTGGGILRNHELTAEIIGTATEEVSEVAARFHFWARTFCERAHLGSVVAARQHLEKIRGLTRHHSVLQKDGQSGLERLISGAPAGIY